MRCTLHALGPNIGPIDPELAVVIDAWASLPETVRADFLAKIRAVSGG